PFQQRIEGKGITFRFKGYRAIWLVLGSTFHAELVGHRLGGKPEIYALYLARHDDVEVFTVTVLVIHVLSLTGQKYMQIRRPSNPEGLINSIGCKTCHSSSGTDIPVVT